ncbi:MAG TPA: bifunctional shikimate kinase/3-dehydroquinate synthase [Solirubrobacteraceae bacterium]|jgi:shikimate kinase/3-dehydroquinate synthase|nr:bifunctional shikimate kinase/3-dehydroquinate synthase [Solirubrobacteraceae bacterium]
MGAGKSTAARQVAAIRGGRSIDTDARVEERLGHTIAEEFARRGEASFRALEEEVTLAELAGAGPSDAVSLGGGAILSSRVRDALASHTVVLIDVDLGRAWGRAAGRRRPLARDRERFASLFSERAPQYTRLAKVILPAHGREHVARALGSIDALAGAPPGTRMLWATSSSGDYPVLIGRGLVGAGVWPVGSATGGRRFVITDEHVGPVYLDRLGRRDGAVTIAAGETSKTLATAELVWRELARRGVARDDHLVGLGGGVVGDLAGFCAATYQRGVPIVHVPTTLVAQVDSAYGGKTGVDLPEAKNYVGAYHQPVGVVVDTQTLETLPAAEFSAGYAEVVKTALIAGGDLWRRVAADDPIDDEVVTACARLKLSVVAEDERDAGRRQVLNLGHTVGHAIEVVTGYGRYRHGEAVGLGLLAALRLSGQDALRADVRELLAAHDLPVEMAGVDVGAVVAATAHDKKRMGGSVPFVLVHAPGDVRPGAAIGAGELEAAVRELCS